MKVRYIRDCYRTSFLKDKSYECIGILFRNNEKYYRVIDESGEDYIYSSPSFEIVEGSEEEFNSFR